MAQIELPTRLVPCAQPETCTAPPRWTLKKLVAWLKETYDLCVSRETVRQALKRLGMSWKKAKALLNRANTAKRAAFAEQSFVSPGPPCQRA